MRGDIRSEWDDTKQHDVLFLLTIRPPDQAELAILQQDGAELHPAEKFGLAYVRGCEVLEVKDEGALPSPPAHAPTHAHPDNPPTQQHTDYCLQMICLVRYPLCVHTECCLQVSLLV